MVNNLGRQSMLTSGFQTHNTLVTHAHKESHVLAREVNPVDWVQICTEGTAAEVRACRTPRLCFWVGWGW